MLKKALKETGGTQEETTGDLTSIVARRQREKSDVVTKGHPMQASIEVERQQNRTTRPWDGFIFEWIAVIAFIGGLCCLLYGVFHG